MRSYLLLPILSGTLAACTVGPDYAGPPKVASGDAAAFVRAGEGVTGDTPALARWWTSLGDARLDALIDEALKANTDINAGEARLRQARAVLREERANQAPKANASALYAHAHVPGASLGSGGDGEQDANSDSDLNLYNVGLDASWEVDLFGGQRRSKEAARASMEGAEASLADIQVSVSAEVAQSYLALRDRQQRITLGEQALVLQQDILTLTQQRRVAGTATAAELADAESRLDAMRAQIAPMKAERDAYLNALAVLCGHQPGALDGALSQASDIPLPPASVAVGDPAALIAHRPDVRAAERELAARTAKIGQAEAARFPRLSFMGLIGIGGTKVSDLGKLDDFVAIGAPQLSWSFLDFGRNRARVGQAEAARDEAEARYQASVLAALRDAEDSLARFRGRRETVAALARVRDKAGLTARLAQERYRAGTATKTASIGAEADLNRAQQDLVSARAALTGDFVAIQKALGLGWEEQ